ncbi:MULTISPECIES: DUF7093 family protein [Haloarcula]|uniref:Uncharacterized protein n=1 Tax=Haloarcula pellucida TaxID=1427151 RepID=A0A830GQ65_9EURY|nr:MULTISPECIES: hypothetical protein [Halomicroarcula]MBX0350182.1 MSCRAMM family adhesin SdrC [Halomicroarcula pellucida]MDS0277716.1 MSCRAMM family adhesin SdrC [Halomicroarcula sp. S1AR25-4]GGO00781.1 hypothetical protein GCM10009030_33810 [Halomicroarcula pellucida]
MGLKCSVLGHTYGEATVEREREEQGSEVVITIQERETCERCGKTRIVSENKEVTAIETPSDIAGDMVDDEDETSTADADGVEEGTVGVPDDGATDGTADESTDEVDGGPANEPAEPMNVGDSATDIVDSDADDAEILDDSDEEADRGGDSELENPTTDVHVPDAEAEDPVTDAGAEDPETDDALIIDGEDEESRSDDREPGQWPDEPGDDGDDWTPETVLGGDDDTHDSAAVESADSTAVTVPEGQFQCPECGFTTDVEASSLRAGDFCPECHKGSLVTDTE